MFASFSRSWEFAKLSYGTLTDHKHLLVFPVVSTAATLLVLMSFLVPFAATGQLDVFLEATGDGTTTPEDTSTYVAAFLFYFCNYFVIVFFNTALVASVMDIFEGGRGSIGFGLKFATRRIHAIFGWALVSAVVGMILNALERNRKIGSIVAALLGSAWTALSYFVIPVIVSEGVGPVEAFKRSTRTLKETWGTALTGNFSMGAIGFLLLLPVLVLGAFLFFYTSPVLALAVTIPLILLSIVATSTADMIFKAYLYTYATGRALPDRADPGMMSEAFSHR